MQGLPILVRVAVAFAGRPARDFRYFEKVVVMPAAPFPGLEIYFVGPNSAGSIIAGAEPRIESRILWDTNTGQYVVDNIDFRFEEAEQIVARLMDWGFQEGKE